MNEILLSICIPTYNRCDILDQTLDRLFCNPEFDSNLIEVIVSDNCSTDNTEEVVKKYPLARYYKNIQNIKDLNFSVVLGYAKGKYIRLFNDTLTFKPNILNLMLERIVEYMDVGVNLFFYANMFSNSDCFKVMSSKGAYIREVSYFSTWIANFGVWKDDFELINDKDRYADLRFTQVDWSYRIVKNSKRTIIYFDDMFSVATPNKKGGYNIFDTFVNKYLFIIKQEDLSFVEYELEKYRLFRYFVYPWLTRLIIPNETEFGFDLKGAYGVIFGKYWYEPYIYPFLLFFYIKRRKNDANN
ncbi:glycosyltransferase family 2 protein [Pedobacter cryoconitis]|uniref:Glycosyltransferase involved in cell wall biosynthesis n=1 Tax=Pedobacter cryoconitis TaxID=188932 RepID=A0A7X0J844_9SPHI|nr:glycosyltransferase family 2 protein [Pedobacter cryoconitis]MBB6502404.1 glycosyltransferase involved in cell wall biosynthesis [Pedobacter cryoconitis]